MQEKYAEIYTLRRDGQIPDRNYSKTKDGKFLTRLITGKISKLSYNMYCFASWIYLFFCIYLAGVSLLVKMSLLSGFYILVGFYSSRQFLYLS